MAATPKKKATRSRGGKRRAHKILSLPNLAPCPSCGKPKLPHTVCPSCGAYGSTTLTTSGPPHSHQNKQDEKAH
ncbi:50S ribosomal protein L32 [Candidatus Microgenomates bacterium]|nr:50S ribosomal protein L32 [Candidatus Microgenomates bacterium]